MAEFPEVVICKCGAYASVDAAQAAGWLVAWRPDGSGRLVMRCPSHITAHARRMAGLPDRVSIRRVSKLIYSGLEVEDRQGRRWRAAPAQPGEFLLCQVGAAVPAVVPLRYFRSVPELANAMARVADLRRWRLAD